MQNSYLSKKLDHQDGILNQQNKYILELESMINHNNGRDSRSTKQQNQTPLETGNFLYG